MPTFAARICRLLPVAFAAILLVGLLPAAVTAHDPAQPRFMRALGHVESGGRYDARNPDSGAYGKYQIMPANWRAWARQYLGDANARPTPQNQERVARAKIHALKHWLGQWHVVAHWWLTGSDSRNTDTWSTYSKRYVRKVMAAFEPDGQRRVVIRRAGDAYSRIRYRGGWRTARHNSYSNDTAHYAVRRGASARYTFKGRSITWVAATGPTRGRARVFVDGRLIRTVDLRARSFHARVAVFSRSWRKPGRHTIRIVVLATAGRRTVSLDELVVRS
jgi:hypothetical protein